MKYRVYSLLATTVAATDPYAFEQLAEAELALSSPTASPYWTDPNGGYHLAEFPLTSSPSYNPIDGQYPCNDPNTG